MTGTDTVQLHSNSVVRRGGVILINTELPLKPPQSLLAVNVHPQAYLSDEILPNMLSTSASVTGASEEGTFAPSQGIFISSAQPRASSRIS